MDWQHLGEEMSYPSAMPRSYQIDVIDQVGSAYRTVLDNVQLVVEMALLPYLIVLGIVAALIPGAGMFGVIWASLVRGIGFLVFGSVFAVRWHRFVLLREAVSGGLIPPGWTAFIAAGLSLGVAVFVGWVLLILFATLPPHILTAPLAAAGGFALALGALRASLIFPAAAIERPVGVRAAWHWMSGNFWRLFACALACYVPFVLVQLLVAALAAVFPSLIWIVFEAIHLAVGFIAGAVAAALLSHLYRDIVGGLDPAG